MPSLATYNINKKILLFYGILYYGTVYTLCVYGKRRPLCTTENAIFSIRSLIFLHGTRVAAAEGRIVKRVSCSRRLRQQVVTSLRSPSPSGEARRRIYYVLQ